MKVEWEWDSDMKCYRLISGAYWVVLKHKQDGKWRLLGYFLSPSPLAADDYGSRKEAEADLEEFVQKLFKAARREFQNGKRRLLNAARRMANEE